MSTERTPRARIRSRRHRRSGFTLVELLVSMLLTTVVIGGTYVLFSSSSEVFHQQELTAENHFNIRFATEQLKRDVERAGFNATPNATDDPWVCPKPTFTLPGISITETSVTTTGGLTIDFDQIVVVGDMSIAPTYNVSSLTGTQIVVDDDGGTLDNDVFGAAFATPSLVRVTNPDGLAQFAIVDSVDAANLTLDLDTSISQSAGTSCGYNPLAAENHEVNPVRGYLYTIVDASTANDPDKTDLVRQEVTFSATSIDPVANTQVTIAEYVVDMEFLPLGVSATSNPTAPSVVLETAAERRDLDTSSATSASVLTDIATRPEGARYLVYRIATRTRRAMPRRLVVPASAISNSAAEQLYFELSDGEVAEVRTIQGRIDLPNFVLANLR